MVDNKINLDLTPFVKVRLLFVMNKNDDENKNDDVEGNITVSYTHLTLPTKRIV